MSRRQGLAVLAAIAVLAAVLAGVLGARHPRSCRADAPRGTGSAWLTQALADVPCPGSGAAVYGAKDDRGAPIDALDPIAAPGGGYLGVYHTPIRAGGPGSSRFAIVLARSSDLLQWRRIRVLERGASMPTLRQLPGGGYLLADELGGRRDTVELHWFGSLPALLQGRAARSIDLPLRYSASSNGTPAFVAVDWRGAVQRSRIVLSFHYETSAPHRAAGPDREALGVLSGFRRWQTRRDSATDALLAPQYPGSHGDQRWFAYDGRTWRILEAQTQPMNFASWHVLVYLPSARRFAPLTIDTAHGRFDASFGNPIAQVLPAPGGAGQVLAVTMFVFSSGPAASQPGELVFFRPVPRSR